MTHIHDHIEAKAQTDGQYAIAYAVLQLAEQQKATARALDSFGMNNQVPAGAPGALEMVGMQMKAIAEALGQIAVGRSRDDAAGQ